MSMVDITGFQRHRRAKAAADEQERAATASEASDDTLGTVKLTTTELDEIMRNKANVMVELKKHDAEFSDRTGVEMLRSQLAKVLGEKGLLPYGNDDQ